ncbi:MAG: heavy-metal-associated domain-containing protein [Pseudomonadota bacterium]
MQTIASPDRPVSEALLQPRTGWPLRLRLPLRWPKRVGAALLALILLGGAYAIVLAQVSGNRGITPTASSSDIEIRGISIDVTGKNAEDARQKGWKRAQRLAWAKAGGPSLPDSKLSGLVSSFIIQREQIGPTRYIATLGVIFDRQRAGKYLGGATRARSSAPMLMIPVTVSAGTYTAFEVRNPWQRAWAEFNPGTSRIDYVRPSGAGGDSLLLNFGQTGRRSRSWWRSTLDQYNAADVLIPTARLEHQFPGGPITGTFTARYGPDSRVLESFELEADDPSALSDMLNEAAERMDAIFERALAQGKLRPDPTLTLGGSGEVDPALQRLIEIGEAIVAREEAATLAAAEGEIGGGAAAPRIEGEPVPDTPAPAVVVTNVIVQFATPDALTFDAALSGVRGTPGVRALAVTSTAMGGTSVMSVSYGGSADELAAALQARGFRVNQSGNTLAISR